MVLKLFPYEKTQFKLRYIHMNVHLRKPFFPVQNESSQICTRGCGTIHVQKNESTIPCESDYMYTRKRCGEIGADEAVLL